jgi:alpha(1,3/1,4) fucosyltransferase
LAFENCNSPGYITEKMIDAFKSGVVPLYWGGGELLKEAVPSNCYIDCSDQDPAGIYRMIKDMTHQEVVSFRKAAIGFLKSDEANRFTGRYLRREIIKRLEGGIEKGS